MGNAVLGGTLRAEEVDLGAEREHEVVVRDRRQLGEPRLALLQVDFGDRVLMHCHVRLLVEQVAQWMADELGSSRSVAS